MRHSLTSRPLPAAVACVLFCILTGCTAASPPAQPALWSHQPAHELRPLAARDGTAASVESGTANTLVFTRGSSRLTLPVDRDADVHAGPVIVIHDRFASNEDRLHYLTAPAGTLALTTLEHAAGSYTHSHFSYLSSDATRITFLESLWAGDPSDAPKDRTLTLHFPPDARPRIEYGPWRTPSFDSDLRVFASSN